MDSLRNSAKTLDANPIAKYLDGMALGRQYPLIDRILDGRLEDRLRADRAVGKSYFTIASEFTRDGFAVTHETVRMWCTELDIPKGDGNEAA